MKTTLLSLRLRFSAAGFSAKLCLLALTSLFCFSNNLSAKTTAVGPGKNNGLFGATIISINTIITSPTNATSVQYTVTFQKDETGVGPGNFSLTTTGGITGASVSTVSGSNRVYTVTINTGTGDGTIGLNLASSSGISPAITTALPFSGEAYTIDKTIPGVNTLYLVSSNINSSVAVVGDVVTLNFGSTETIQEPATVTIGGHTVTPVSVSTNLYKATYTMTSADPDGRVHFTLQFTDLAGNSSGTYNDLAAGDDVEFSKELPSASNVSFVSNNANTATAIIGNKVTLAFTASETIKPPVITIAGHTVTAAKSGNTYTVSYTMVASDPAGNIIFDAALVDPVTNATTHVTNVSSGDNVLFNNVATVAVTGTVASLKTVPGTPSVARSFRVSGFNLSAGVFVEAPTGFELSADNITFSRNITVGTGGVIAPTLVYIRLSALDLSGTYGSQVLVSSAGASEVTLTPGSSTVDALLGTLTISSGTLSPAFNSETAGYLVTLPGNITSVTVTPRNADGVASLMVDGAPVVSGEASASLPLVTGANYITILVTSMDNTVTKTYTIKVMKAPSNDATLSSLSLGGVMFHPAFVPNRMQYTSTVSNTVASLTVTPATANALATVKVDGTAVTSGTPSASIPLVTGPNTVTITVVAENGVTTKTYTVTVTRALPANANITRIKLSSGTLSPAFAQATTSYTASVTNAVSSITVTPTASDPLATITVNGSPVTSGSASGAVALNVGANTITTKATAQDGTTTKTYTITVTRAMAAANSLYQPASVIKPVEDPRLANDGIAVHQALSPNGDGDNDFLVIDGITNYPDNELLIMSRTGDLVYEVSGYDNHSRVFDGHSNKNGKMQSPGTYFYSLDYKVGGVAKHKTGFIVLKY